MISDMPGAGESNSGQGPGRNRRVLGAAFTWTMLALPFLSGAEVLISGNRRILFFHDLIIPSSASIVFALISRPAVFLARRIWSWDDLLGLGLAAFFFLLLYKAAPKSLTARVRRAISSHRWAIARFCALMVLTLFWLNSILMHPGLTTILASAGLLVTGARFARMKSPDRERSSSDLHSAARKVLYLVLCANAAAFIFLNEARFLRARQLPAGEVYPHSAYDAMIGRHGTQAVLTSTEGVQLFDGLLWHGVEGVSRSQGCVFDEKEDKLYIADYLTEGTGTIVVRGRQERKAISLEGCSAPIDLALFDEGKTLLVACEHSCKVFSIDAGTGSVLRRWDNIYIPYSLAVDEKHGFAYASCESGFLYELDLSRGTRRSVFLGPILSDVKYDPREEVIWVGRLIHGEVIALDRRMKILGRVRTGWGSRRMALDSSRNLILVDNYATGTIDAIDGSTRRLRQSYRVGGFDALPLLRGIQVLDDGTWLISERRGVWRAWPE